MKLRFSSELHPDEGFVFVTSVPGSPFQILGRRDPKNGELCVGSLFYGGMPSDDLPCEIVTGQEAQQLLNAVVDEAVASHRWHGRGRVFLEPEGSDGPEVAA
jgi:hypothetical protein